MEQLKQTFTDIANAIREKDGSTSTIKPSKMASKIENIPSFRLKNYLDTCTSMGYYFYRFGSMTDEQLSNAIVYSDTQNVTNMEYMFFSCTKLTSIPELDTQNVTNMAYMFKYCTNLTEINMINIGCNLDVTSTELKHNALVKLINNLKSGVTSKTLTMGSSKLALLSDEEKKVATDKGWTLA